MSVYEAMFLLDSGRAGDWNAATAYVHGILTRYGARVVDSRKWDERRLAYEIKGRKRGAYMLVYFEAPQPSIASIRRDLELSDAVLRYLIVVRERYEAAEAAVSPAVEPAGAGQPGAEAPAGQEAPTAPSPPSEPAATERTEGEAPPSPEPGAQGP